MMSAAVPGGRETLRDMYIYIYEYAYTIETKDLIIIDQLDDQKTVFFFFEDPQSVDRL